jgi:hypothetical protein
VGISVKAFDYDLKLGPIVIGTLVVLAMLTVVFFGMHIHRVKNLYQADYSPCAQYRTNYMHFSRCMTLKVYDFLKHPQWLAAQFACYMLVTIIGGIFCAWLAGGQRQVAVPLIACITVLLASLTFNPWGLAAVTALLGVPLGGAIFQVFYKRRRVAPTNSP